MIASLGDQFNEESKVSQIIDSRKLVDWSARYKLYHIEKLKTDQYDFFVSEKLTSRVKQKSGLN